jgi:hypothetical protein
MPNGGYEDSGHGRGCGPEGLDEDPHTTSVLVDLGWPATPATTS